MVKYREILKSEKKLLLSYFIGFFDNESILPKIGPNNYILKNLDQRLIIMIIYNKSTFFANNSY